MQTDLYEGQASSYKVQVDLYKEHPDSYKALTNSYDTYSNLWTRVKTHTFYTFYESDGNEYESKKGK